MNQEQRDYESQLNRWSMLLIIVRQGVVLALAYAAVRIFAEDMPFSLIFTIWTGLWGCDLVAGLILRPWTKPHKEACINFDIKTREQHIQTLECELESEREQVLELLSERSESYEREKIMNEAIVRLKKEIEDLYKLESDAWYRLSTGSDNQPDWMDSLDGDDARKFMLAIGEVYYRQIICDGDRELYEKTLIQSAETKSIP